MKDDHESTLLRDGATMVAANLVFAGTAFALTILAARRLGPAGFGEWGALWSIMLVTAALFPSVSMLAAREVARECAAGRPESARALASRIGVVTAGIGLAPAVLLTLKADAVAAALRIAEPSHIVLVAWFFWISWVLAFVRGALEGAQRFNGLGLNVAGEGALRLAMGAVVLFAGGVIGGLLGSYIAAAVIACAFAWAEWRRPLDAATPRNDEPAAIRWSYFAPVFAAHLLIVALANADMMLVKRYFPAEAAGWYSVGFTGGKFMFFFAEGVAVAMFPKAVAAHAAGRSPRPILIRALALYIGGAALTVAVAAAAPAFLVSTIFGPEYDEARRLLLPYLLYSSMLGAMVVTAKYRLAEGRFAFLAALAGAVVVLVGGIVVYHPSLVNLVWGLFLFGALAVFALLLPIVQEDRLERTRT